jgi:hypothetical protein
MKGVRPIFLSDIRFLYVAWDALCVKDADGRRCQWFELLAERYQPSKRKLKSIVSDLNKVR